MPSIGTTPATPTTATTTPLSPIRTSPTSKNPRAGGYHYEKKNPSSSSSPSGATTPLPNTQQQITSSSPRRGSRQEAAQVITTIGKNHKSNFSIGAFLGGAPHSALSGYTLPSGSRQSEPKTGGIREQFSGSLSQGPLLLPPPPPNPSPPHTSPNPGAVGSTANRAGVITTTKLKALEASSSQDQTGPLLRNLSPRPLRLKMPTSLRKIGRSASNNKQEPQTTTTTTTPSRLNSLRPFSPFSLRSPIVGDERRGLKSKSKKNESQYSLGAMQFERGNSTGSSASSPSLSTASSQEEDLPLTPSTIRSGNLRPRSPVVPELPPSQGRSSNLSFSERPFPTITQDDLSLVHTTQLAADNRISRRASVSATSMLSSSNHLSSYDDGDRPRQQQQQQHPSSTTTTTTPLTIPPTGRTDKSQLSPMTFERAPTPDLDSAELLGYELPTPRLPPKPSSTTLLPPEKDIHDNDDNDDDNVGSAPTPIATLNPEMPFNTFIIPSSSLSHHLHDTSTTSGSNPQSRSVSRAGSSELGGGGTATAASDSRNSLSDTMHPRIGGGGGGGFSSKKKREKISPAQQALWEQDRERITRDMMDAYDGEAILIRFEPKQGWIGFWNRGDIDRVIDGLRDLRSPKP